MLERFKPFLIIGGIVALVVGWSYLNEAPYRSFRDQVLADQARVPFSRVIGTGKSGDLGSPWSFVESRTHLISIAAPDPSRPDWFRVVSRHFDQAEPSNYLVEADCSQRILRWFGEGNSENATELARNVLGEPVLGPSGEPLGLIENVPAPEQWTSGICDHDWAPERAALAEYAEQRSP